MVYLNMKVQNNEAIKVYQEVKGSEMHKDKLPNPKSSGNKTRDTLREL